MLQIPIVREGVFNQWGNCWPGFTSKGVGARMNLPGWVPANLGDWDWDWDCVV